MGPFEDIAWLAWPNQPTIPQYAEYWSRYRTAPHVRRQPLPYKTWYYMYTLIRTEGLTDDRRPGAGSPGPDDPSNWVQEGSPLDYLATNRARARFIKMMTEVDDPASLGETLGEGREAFQMMSNRLKQLGAFFSALKRRDYKTFRREMGSRQSWNPKYESVWNRYAKKGISPNDVRGFAQAFGSAILEYKLGWQPLVNDCHAAITTMENLNPSKRRIRARGSVKETFSVRREIGNTQLITGSAFYKHRVQLCANVALVNPNLGLMASLGLVNPAQLAWNLTSLSFLFDYMANVGKYLESWQDTLGWLVDNLVTSRTWEIDKGSYSYYDRISQTYPYTGYSVLVEAYRFVRALNLDLPEVELEFRPIRYLGISETRNNHALISIALLLQQLKPLKQL